MSWNAEYRRVHPSNPDLSIDKADFKSENLDIPENLHQFTEARNAVESLLDSECIGPDTHYYKVTLSGHSNAEGQTASAWMNIAIGQTDDRID